MECINHCRDPDNKVHGANMGPSWVLSAPDGPHVGLMNLAIRGVCRGTSGETTFSPAMAGLGHVRACL